MLRISGSVIAALLASSLMMAVQAGNEKHLFILSGQSNMRQPLPKSFEEAVSKVFGKDNVGVVMHAHPSQPIRRWYKNWTPPEGMARDDQKNGTLYDALLSKVNRAIKGKQFATTTFIWMQGEADAGKGWGAVYEKSFLGVLDQFKQDLKLDKINFVLGRINDNYYTKNGTKDGDLVRKIQQKLGEDHPNGDWVDTDDLNCGVNPWGLYNLADGHFPPAGYRVMGQRFAFKACKLIDPKMKADPAIFQAGFMDSSDDVKTHVAVGKPVTGAASDPKHKGAAKVTALTDSTFGSTDPSDGKWIGVPPKTESAAWVVDLGAEQDVSSIAVSFLINKKVSAGFPVSIEFAASNDGNIFQPLFRRRKQTAVRFGYRDSIRLKWNSSTPPQSLLALYERATKARYIRITAKTAESWLFIDEIAVDAVAKRAAVVPKKD